MRKKEGVQRHFAFLSLLTLVILAGFEYFALCCLLPLLPILSVVGVCSCVPVLSLLSPCMNIFFSLFLIPVALYFLFSHAHFFPGSFPLLQITTRVPFMIQAVAIM